MNNFHNILPIICIDIFIILLFEGLLFFLYLDKQQENIIFKQLMKFFENNNEDVSKQQSPQTQEQTIKLLLRLFVAPYIKQSMDGEKFHIKKQYEIGVIIFTFMLVFITISLAIYSYLVYYIFGKTINWGIVAITVIITILLIIILEILYIKYVLFNKKFNENQIKVDFIEALLQ